MLNKRLARVSVKLQPIEHQVWRELKLQGIIRKKIVIGFSGGLDSVVLTTLLLRLQPLHKCDLQLVHVHHGLTTNKKQLQFRNRAQIWAKKFSQTVKIPYTTNKKSSLKNLSSENEFREYRYEFFAQIISKISGQKSRATVLLALGHHADDLLETQLMRLIRGVGPEGLESMSIFNSKILRPLLLFERKAIYAYAKKLKLKWLEDPSNSDDHYLRNWMRQSWLRGLEKKIPGSILVLARSLRIIAEANAAKQKQKAKNVFTVQSLGNERQKNKSLVEMNRHKLLAQGHVDQRAELVRLLLTLKIRNYSLGHIEEIRRRLDNSRASFTFTILKHEWRINAERVFIVKI